MVSSIGKKTLYRSFLGLDFRWLAQLSEEKKHSGTWYQLRAVCDLISPMEPVTQDMGSVERGRIPCHDVQFEVERLRRGYGAARLQQQSMLLMARAGAPPAAWLAQMEHCSVRVGKQARAIRDHYNSYDMVTRASKDYGQPRINEPWVELRHAEFEAAVSWTKDEFLSMCDSLELLPAQCAPSWLRC